MINRKDIWILYLNNIWYIFFYVRNMYNVWILGSTDKKIIMNSFEDVSVPSRCSFFFTKTVSVRIFLWYIINSYFWNLFNPLTHNGLIMNQQILSQGKYYDFYASQQYIFGIRSLISIYCYFFASFSNEDTRNICLLSATISTKTIKVSLVKTRK